MKRKFKVGDLVRVIYPTFFKGRVRKIIKVLYRRDSSFGGAMIEGTVFWFYEESHLKLAENQLSFVF